MKMTPSDVALLTAALNSAVERNGLEKVQAYHALKLGKDTAQRFRWDLFWSIPAEERDPMVRGFYKYMNDSHIDTALRAYVASRPELTEEPAKAA
jgi:hypothetical protein